MLGKKLTGCAFTLLFLFSVDAVQAVKPEEQVTGIAEHSESFWDRWFSRSEKVERRADDDRLETKKNKEKKGKHKQTSDHYFSELERSHIEDYYRRDHDRYEYGDKKDKKNKKNKGKKLPYGLQKKLDRGGQLPPGWQTKVARGEVLDADILRHSERIPDELIRRLSELRDGEEIRRVGNKVVRVLEGNGTVIDVVDLADVLLR